MSRKKQKEAFADPLPESSGDDTSLEPTQPEGTASLDDTAAPLVAVGDENQSDAPEANPGGDADPEPEPVKNLVVEGSLTLKSANGRGRIVLQAMEDISGLWISTEAPGDKHPRSCIALYDDAAGPVIGFYRDIGEDAMQMHFAVCLENGHPTLQVENGRGSFGRIGLHELLDKVKPDWR